MTEEQPTADHVVMLVLNDVTGDSRVQKSATAVARAGFRVTVVGRATTSERCDEFLGDVRIVRVPVDLVIKRYVNSARAIPITQASDEPDPIAERAVRRLVRAQRRTMRIGRLRASLDSEARRSRLSRAVRWSAILVLRRLAHRDRSVAHKHLKAARRPERRAVQPTAPPETVRWRDELPVISDFELAYLPVVQELQPDIIHAHDHSALAIAEHATLLARAGGRPAKLVYDAHEYVRGVPQSNARVAQAWIDLEHEHIGTADAVITVSPVLSERLKAEHGLPVVPAVVLNAPVLSAFDPSSKLSVRAAAGLEEDVPLLVYSGGVKPQRGVGTLVKALPYMEGVHAAVVARAESAAVEDLRELAGELACADRLHIVPFVAPDLVSSYLRSADVGVHTILRSGNADIALPNKMFEYFHAGLPMVVSDVVAMAQFTREHGTGEVFPAGDHRALAAACLIVLHDLERYRRPLSDPEFRRRYSWERQAEILIAVYKDLATSRGLAPPAEASGVSQA
jgi:glycosyltransferase involved in cell wall biosynthesis